MGLTKKISLWVLIIGYLLAGSNHFVHPSGYIAIIPAYIPFPKLMNTLAGGFELLFALLLVNPKSRPFAAWGIILMLTAFLPVHIDMLIRSPFILGSFLVTPFIALARLALQFMLIAWAGWYGHWDKRGR